MAGLVERVSSDLPSANRKTGDGAGPGCEGFAWVRQCRGEMFCSAERAVVADVLLRVSRFWMRELTLVTPKSSFAVRAIPTVDVEIEPDGLVGELGDFVCCVCDKRSFSAEKSDPHNATRCSQWCNAVAGRSQAPSGWPKRSSHHAPKESISYGPVRRPTTARWHSLRPMFDGT